MKRIRKNFLFDESVANHLEELARDEKKSMTLLLQEMIEKEYKKIKVQKRVKALQNIVGSANGLFNEKTIQEIKAEINV